MPTGRFKRTRIDEPLPRDYLRGGWLEGEGEDLRVRPALLQGLALRKAYELLEQDVALEAVQALVSHLERLGFGVPPGADLADLKEPERSVIFESIVDAASDHPLLASWMTAQALPFVKNRLDVQALCRHAAAVLRYLATLSLSRVQHADPDLEVDDDSVNKE